MPTFRLTTRDGQQTTVHAARVVVSSDDIRFQVRHGGSWTQVASTPLADAASVERQLTEFDGRRSYVRDREVSAALAALADELVHTGGRPIAAQRSDATPEPARTWRGPQQRQPRNTLT